MTRVGRQKDIVAAALAAVAAATTDGAYLYLIHQQNASDPHSGIVPFVSGYIAGICAAAILGIVLVQRRRRRAAKAVFIAAFAGSWALGILAIFSIGVALLITSGFLVFAANSVPADDVGSRGWLAPAAGVAIALGVLAAGFAIANT